MTYTTTPRYWMGEVPPLDDFNGRIVDEFIDGKTRRGSWGLMNRQNWRRYGVDFLGLGRGQRYAKQADGRWLKVEG